MITEIEHLLHKDGVVLKSLSPELHHTYRKLFYRGLCPGFSTFIIVGTNFIIHRWTVNISSSYDEVDLELLFLANRLSNFLSSIVIHHIRIEFRFNMSQSLEKVKTGVAPESPAK